MRKQLGIRLVAILLLGVQARSGEAGDLLAKIKSVGREGVGNVEASKAWRELVKLGPDALIDILTGMDDANATAANWIRGAVDAIAEGELNAGRPLPNAKLEAFVRDRKRNGRARRQAFEWLSRVDKTVAGRPVTRILDDPGAG